MATAGRLMSLVNNRAPEALAELGRHLAPAVAKANVRTYSALR